MSVSQVIDTTRTTCQACIRGKNIDVGDLKMSDHTLTAQSGCIMMRQLGKIFGYHLEGPPQLVGTTPKAAPSKESASHTDSTTPKRKPPLPPPVAAPPVPPPPHANAVFEHWPELEAQALNIAEESLASGAPLELQRAEDLMTAVEASRIARQRALQDNRQLATAAPRPGVSAPPLVAKCSQSNRSSGSRSWNQSLANWHDGWSDWQHRPAPPPPPQPESGNAWDGWDQSPAAGRSVCM
jgi:hypothetical protein